jgi:hypothetical protein
MFEVGEIVVCVDIKPHNYGNYYEHLHKKPKEIKTITMGKRYDVIESDKHNTTVINDSGIRKVYRTDRFKSITKDRRTKVKKLKEIICSKLAI